MKIENYYPVLSLVGLVVDIIGAFFLSIEAIGIDKILNWKLRIFDLPSKILKARKVEDMEGIAQSAGYPKFYVIFVGLLSGVGALIGGYLSIYIDKLFFNSKHTFTALIIGIISSSIFVFFMPDFLANLLQRVSYMLKWTELNFKKGQIGLIGFTFLLLGFVLQFLGTLLQFLNNIKQ